MTWAAMGCGPDETARRQAVCERLNKLWTMRNSTEDKAKQKRLDREFYRVLRTEAQWLKEAACWLY